MKFFAAFADEADDEGGPAGLVGGAEAFAGVAVEVFVKKEETLPIGALCVGWAFSKTGAITVFIREEKGDEAVANVDGNFAQRQLFSRTRGVFEGEAVAVEIVVAFEGLNDEKIGREPDRAAPVRVATEHGSFGLAGLVVNLAGHHAVVKNEGFFFVRFRERADAEIGQKFVGIQHAGEAFFQTRLAGNSEEDAAVVALVTANVDVF